MSDGSVKIDGATLKRLRTYLVKKYEGELYGKIGETVTEAVNEYLDRVEKAEKPRSTRVTA
jgi:hypothetical protein